MTTSNFTPHIFKISPAGFTRRAFIKFKNLGNTGCQLKIQVILYLTQIYFLTKYLVENAENSISETLDFIFFWGGGGGEHAFRPPRDRIICKHISTSYVGIC